MSEPTAVLFSPEFKEICELVQSAQAAISARIAALEEELDRARRVLGVLRDGADPGPGARASSLLAS